MLYCKGHNVREYFKKLGKYYIFVKPNCGSKEIVASVQQCRILVTTLLLTRMLAVSFYRVPG